MRSASTKKNDTTEKWPDGKKKACKRVFKRYIILDNAA